MAIILSMVYQAFTSKKIYEVIKILFFYDQLTHNLVFSVYKGVWKMPWVAPRNVCPESSIRKRIPPVAFHSAPELRETYKHLFKFFWRLSEENLKFLPAMFAWRNTEERILLFLDKMLPLYDRPLRSLKPYLLGAFVQGCLQISPKILDSLPHMAFVDLITEFETQMNFWNRFGNVDHVY